MFNGEEIGDPTSTHFPHAVGRGAVLERGGYRPGHRVDVEVRDHQAAVIADELRSAAGATKAHDRQCRILPLRGTRGPEALPVTAG